MLYIVATPIGNLSDISLRALNILAEVDCVLAEDTRVTGVLLKHFQLSKPLQSVREQTPESVLAGLIERMKQGEAMAFVSDAGTPAISDPGGKLVELAHHAGIKVVPIPGPSAVTAALSVAGFPASEFVFLGYFPKKKGRQTLARALKSEKRTVVLFETGPRIMKTLELLRAELGGEREIVICRELTKIYEEVIRARLQEVPPLTEKGEFAIVLAPA